MNIKDEKQRKAVEEIFSMAQVMDQNGGLRNSVYVEGKEIYILNYDHTVLVRFRLKRSEPTFEDPISFRASDYEGIEFKEVDGKIIFTTEKAGHVRNKSCGRAEYSVEEVREMFNNLLGNAQTMISGITLNQSIMGLLDADLSHIEFSGEKGDGYTIVQRNIYSGGVITVTPASKRLDKVELEESFGPVGIKTNDLASLFQFDDNLKFEFSGRDTQGSFIIIRSFDREKRDMLALVAGCLYDEIIKIREVQNGRQEPKVRRRK
jgi:hypothetical protein